MSNIKITKEEYAELIEAKAFADDVTNMLQIRINRSDTGLVDQTSFGDDILMPARSYLEKRKNNKNNKEKP